MILNSNLKRSAVNNERYLQSNDSYLIVTLKTSIVFKKLMEDSPQIKLTKQP